MPNFRDAGGHRLAGGGIMRPGLLYRSDHIGPLSVGEARAVAGLGIRVVYDLRTEAERIMAPDECIPGAKQVALDLMADDSQAAPAQLLRLLEHPRVAKVALGNGKAAALFIEGYRSIVTLPSARAGLGRLYGGLLEEAGLPALCHCTTGKDRTGWTCAALQTLLGVPQDEVLRDFLASNRYIVPKYQARVAEFAARGGDPALLTPVLSVLPEYLEASFDEVRRAYGTIEGYFGEALGLDARMQQALC
ncbi:MAG: tyrosine-protein phosphatase, partial [Steroidobacteraceae bacterium]|nr:tyrosine-protein phosphatase [Steroidobacteraceae bacterium]